MSRAWATVYGQLQEWRHIERKSLEQHFLGIEMFSAPHYVYYCSETNTLHLVMSEVFTIPPEIPGWVNIGIFE